MATTMGGYPSGLPTIKCSDCGREIDIAEISEHICRKAQAAPIKAMDRFNNAFSSMRANEKLPAPLRSRAAPTGINTSLANRPFLQAQPPTPQSGQRSPFRMPPRSATSPLFRTRSPSPELPLSQECAFPAWPSSRPGTPGTPRRAQTENVVPSRNTDSRSDSRNRSRRMTTSSHNTTSRPVSPASTHSSRPTTFAADSSRKNSFSGLRPKFDSSNGLPAVPPVPAFSEKRSDSPAGSLMNLRLPFGSPQSENAPADALTPQPPPPAPPAESGQQTLPDTSSMRRRPSQGNTHYRGPSVSAATRPLHEIGSMTSYHRSTVSRGASPDKLNAAPSVMTDVNDRKIQEAPAVPEMVSAQVERPQSRGTIASKSERSLSDDMPAMPLRTKVRELELQNNPYHTPSGSESSSGSAAQTSSSQSSPPTSTSSFPTTRKQSDSGEARLPDGFSAPVPVPAPLNIPNSSSSSPRSAPVMRSQDSFAQPLSAAPVSAPPLDQQIEQFPPVPQPYSKSPTIPPNGDRRPSEFQQRPRRGPAKSFSRPNYGKPIDQRPPPQQQTQPQSQPPPPSFPQPPTQSLPRPPPPPNSHPHPQPHTQPPESPMDPALQGGRLPRINTQDRHGAPGPVSHSPQSAPAASRRSPKIPDVLSPPPPPPHSAHPSAPSFQPPPARRATVGSKGNCRGCGHAIKGKSVSSGDGRLAGRWHKACFVCRTCASAFPSNDFYVLDNHPYCARHYHELNRSMCAQCDRGIEGQFRTTDRGVKYHPACFRCADCQLILREDYWEGEGGRVQCEMHALGNARLAPGRRFPEKRSTRLMMMI